MEKFSLSNICVVFVFCAATAITVPAQTLTTLISFNGPDGVNPTAGLVQGADGNLYGTTYQGGANGNYQGTVFKISPQSPYLLTTLHTFLGYPTDGSFPYAGVVQGTDGFFYGTTANGGTSDNCKNGCGTVFKISADGSQYSVLHSFNGTDGSIPEGILIQATDGNFYGTTFYGGAGNNCADFQPSGCGTVFKISPQSPYPLTTVHSFNFSDGYTPEAGLVEAANGNFYGTTSQGVTAGQTCGYGCGTVFEMTPAGAVTTLHVFQGPDGYFPQAPLIQGRDSSFYGTTSDGGANKNCRLGGCGTVFKISPQSPYTLTTVSLTAAIGSIPAPLLQATDGNFYGTTALDGANGGGSIFELTQSLTLMPVYSFCAQPNCADGDGPEGGLVQDTNGTFYGTAFSGGAFGAGTVFSFSLSVGLGPFVETDPTSGPVGTPVIILGTNLTGATGVTFNGTPATINSNTGSEITTTVPTGATTGLVQVTGTPSGTLSSNATFEVTTPVQFVSVTPCRLVDTRKQYGGGGPISGGTFESFNLAQSARNKGCANLSSAGAYSLNVTVVPSGSLGYLTVWPTGEIMPYVSTMNSLDGRVKANAVIVPSGSDSVSVFASDTTNVVIDIDGYFEQATQSTLAFYTLTPCRVADTRKGLGGSTLMAGVPQDFAILGTCSIPHDAVAYSFNFTAVPYPSLGDRLGYLEVWPRGEVPQNPVSTLNNPTGTVVANAAIVPAGTGGEITAYASDDTDLVIDINGYFAQPGQNGLSLYPTAPCRVLDTRKGSGLFIHELTVNVVGSPCTPPSTAQAYVFNATVVPPGSLGYLTLWPDCMPMCQQPVVSTLNALDGAITSNMAIVPNIDGSTDAYASDVTQLILDISSYFAP